MNLKVEDTVYPLELSKEGQGQFYKIQGEHIYDLPAFYNPSMELNRDLSILFTKLYSQRNNRAIRFYDPLAGIGVRGMRMISEISENLTEVVLNDLSKISYEIMKLSNTLQDNSDLIQIENREARALSFDLAEDRKRYHVIDLDPFGSPAPFIDSIWRVLQKRGLLSVTATDMTALAGVFPMSCLRKYGAISLNNHFTHETAVRILIGLVLRSGGRFERAPIPVFSISADHYIKVFFLLTEGRGRSNKLLEQIKSGAVCTKCQKFKFLSLGETMECCDKIEYFGPVWSGNLFDPDWCSDAINLIAEMELGTKKRIIKFLEEAVNAADIPYYYALDDRASKLGINMPKQKYVIEELLNRGFKSTNTLFRSQSIRTKASREVLDSVLLKLSNP